VRVLAVDPGKTTGLALYRDVFRKSEDMHEWTAWMLPWQQSMDAIVDWIQNGELDHVVCENFVISRNTLTKGADAHWPMGGIGITRWMCERTHVPFDLQMPSDAKGFATNDKLKKLGWKTPGKDHPDDATRHLVLFLARTGAIDPQRLVV
jgi:hypothetical protein